MTNTLTRIRPERSDGKELRLQPAARRRRPLLAVGSLALVAACVALFTSAYLHAGHQESVLAIASPIAQGQVLSPDDLNTARVSISPDIDVVPASAASSVVGRRASIPLVAGTLLAPGDLNSNGSPPRGSAIVGVALKSGQMPAEGVAPGDSVDIVMTGVPGSPDTDSNTLASPSQPASGLMAGPGTVLSPDVLVTAVDVPPASSGSDTVVVSLLVPNALAPTVANASAAGQAALVIVTSRS